MFIYIGVELFYVYAYVVLILGTFLLNYILSLVLFDSGPRWSFVSTSFCIALVLLVRPWIDP